MATEVEPAPVFRVMTPKTGAGSEQRRWWQRPVVLVLGLTAVAGGIPLALALAVLSDPRWYPVSDFAQTELRVRDVTSSHPPLIGLAGRIGGYGKQGSHPGPISFYSLFPVYKAFGSHPWGLLAAAVTLNVTAVGISIGIAYRRAGRIGALAAASALGVLAYAYSPDKLTAPWNPFMPAMWWVVFLLAVWSILCDDLVLLPVAVFAGTFCTQTHVSYLGLVPGVGLVAVGGLAWYAWRDPVARRCIARWTVPSAALLVALWIPPILEQLRTDPGNLDVVRYSFTHSDPPPFGFGRQSISVWLAHLNVGVLVSGTRTSVTDAPTGPIWPGVVLLGLWVGAAVIAWRARHRVPALWRLHLVIAVALPLGLVSATRVIGVYFDYLMLWAWGTTTLVVVAIVWTFVASKGAATAPLLAKNALIGVLVVASAALTYDAAHAKVPMHIPTRFSEHVSPQAVEALERDDPDHEGRYLLRWDADSGALDFHAYGLLVELERAGFDVGVEDHIAVPAATHRLRQPGEATAAINYVIGPEIDVWRAEPGAVEIAYFEPRNQAEQQEYARLRRDLVTQLREANLDELIPLVDDIHLGIISFSSGVTREMHDTLQRMADLGVPVGVFVAPVGVRPEGV